MNKFYSTDRAPRIPAGVQLRSAIVAELKVTTRYRNVGHLLRQTHDARCCKKFTVLVHVMLPRRSIGSTTRRGLKMFSCIKTHNALKCFHNNAFMY